MTEPLFNAWFQPFQRELEQMQDRFDATFRALLNANSRTGALTPSTVVYTEGKRRLVHYSPAGEETCPVPVLIVPSLFSHYSILDLLPGASLIEFLVRHGIDVYVLDWGPPDRSDRFVTFDQYVTGYLRRMVRRVCTLTNQEQLTLLGYSLGGTFSVIFTALYSPYVCNLVTLATPINFHDEGLLSQWTRKGRFNVDLVVDTLGSMPTELMRASFRMLKPTAQIAQRITLAAQLGDIDAVQDFLAMQAWIPDDIPYLGEAYRKLVKDCYQENYLIQGKMIIDGQRVDLSGISCPLLIVTGKHDPICPPASATILSDLVSSADKQALDLPGGHLDILATRNAARQLWPQLVYWLQAHSAPSE